MHQGEMGSSGDLGIRVIRAGDPDVPWPCREMTFPEIMYHGAPRSDLPKAVNDWRAANRSNLWRGLSKIIPARALKIPHFYGQLFLTHIKGDGERIDMGLASLRVVTTVGVKFICDDFNAGGTDVTTLKYHGIGTGGTAEAVGDTALVTESTTALNPASTRATGSQASATVSTNATYTTVGTLTAGSAIAVTEHGIFSQSATGGGTLFDRSLFSVVNLATADSIQATYVWTANSGG